MRSSTRDSARALNTRKPIDRRSDFSPVVRLSSPSIHCVARAKNVLENFLGRAPPSFFDRSHRESALAERRPGGAKRLPERGEMSEAVGMRPLAQRLAEPMSSRSSSRTYGQNRDEGRDDFLGERPCDTG